MCNSCTYLCTLDTEQHEQDSSHFLHKMLVHVCMCVCSRGLGLYDDLCNKDFGGLITQS